ncbi:MAG: carboxypeptidase regulatory-like domain-containing protein [Gemmatimonadaceae bacterium]
MLCGSGGAASAQQPHDPVTLIVGIGDVESGQPVADVEVRIPTLHLGARSDGLGQARITGVPAGNHIVQVRRIGYQPLSVPVAFGQTDTVEATFMMRQIVHRLDAVTITESTVSGALRDFERRRKMGIGRFADVLQLDSAWSRELAMFLVSRFPGVRMQRSRDGLETHLVGTRGGGGGALGGNGTPSCVLNVFIDGVRIYDDDIAALDAGEFQGLELYDGINTPVEYRRLGAGCGTLLLWHSY